MNTIFISNPLSLLFVAGMLMTYIISGLLDKPYWLTLINIMLHIAAIVCLCLIGASLNDILCLLLVSSAVGLWLSGKEKEH